jgi:hypothetical protein
VAPARCLGRVSTDRRDAMVAGSVAGGTVLRAFETDSKDITVWEIWHWEADRYNPKIHHRATTMRLRRSHGKLKGAIELRRWRNWQTH